MRTIKVKTPITAAEQIPAPIALRIPEAERASGLSRTTLYRLRQEGRVKFRKSGRTTLVDYASLKAAVDALPST